MQNKVSEKKSFRLIVLFVILLLIANIFLIYAEERNEKIDSNIYDVLENNDNVRVVVKLNEVSDEKGFFFKEKKSEGEINQEKKEIREEVISVIEDEKIRQVFDDEIAVEVNEEELEILENNENIESIIIDKPIKAFLQDSVGIINASSVWSININGINLTGTDKTVCIIDTGIDFRHPDLAGKNKTCVIDCVGKTCVENCSVRDDNGHGTHVAGIVAAFGGIKGVGVNVGLIGVKVLDSSGSGTGSDLNAGLDWCIANKNNYNISVISMSLGTDCDLQPEYCYDYYCQSELSEVSTARRINNATWQNISVIVATGNDGSTTKISSPACVYNSTAVGAVDKSDNIASYSNRNNLTDLLATGTTINSTENNTLPICSSGGVSCNGNYATISGTSMACPHVAGAFAVIGQFIKLQNNREATPLEIESALNSTGKRIYDSGTGLNFSRIDVYSAILSIDSSNPQINLIYPANSSSQYNQTVSFNCNSSDVLLRNLTLYVWNDTGIFNTSFINTNARNANVSFNLSLNYGDYKWNCLAYDAKGNSSFAQTNKTLTIGRVSVNLNSPSNNSYSNANLSFNCSADSETSKALKNISFYLWNSSRILVYNLTKEISGLSNSSLFNYNFSSQGNYTWNCIAYNNNTESSFANSNYSLVYELERPVVVIFLPTNYQEYSSDSKYVTFIYNVSDNYNIKNCSLIINGVLTSTDSSITNMSVNYSFSSFYTPAEYDWGVNCSDYAGNQGYSNEFTFTVIAVPENDSVSSSSSGGGGGGGAIPVTKIYSPSIEMVKEGYTKELGVNDKVRFSFFDEQSQEHSVIVNKIISNSVELTIRSNPIELKLGVGQSAKLNLTSPDYYDFYIKLNSITNGKADLTIQTINERIPNAGVTGEIILDDKSGFEKQEGIKEGFELLSLQFEKFKIIVYIIAVLFILIVIYLLWKSNQINREEKIKEHHVGVYREIFKRKFGARK